MVVYKLLFEFLRVKFIHFQVKIPAIFGQFFLKLDPGVSGGFLFQLRRFLNYLFNSNIKLTCIFFIFIHSKLHFAFILISYFLFF